MMGNMMNFMMSGLFMMFNIIMMRNMRVDLNMCRILISCSWLIGFDFGPKAMVISNVVNFPVNAVVIRVAVTSFHVAMSIRVFSPVVGSMFVFDVIAEMVRFRVVMLLKYSYILFSFACKVNF